MDTHFLFKAENEKIVFQLQGIKVQDVLKYCSTFEVIIFTKHMLFFMYSMH